MQLNVSLISDIYDAIMQHKNQLIEDSRTCINIFTSVYGLYYDTFKEDVTLYIIITDCKYNRKSYYYLKKAIY